MATMTHNDAQRKDWHDGKRTSWETKTSWFKRVIVKGNFRGGYTPPKFGIYYNRLKTPI